MTRRRFAIAKTVALLAFVAVVCVYATWAHAAADSEASAAELRLETLKESGPGPYATDGVFEGSAEGYGGSVTTRVTVEDGWIASVEVIDASQEDEAWLEMASVLPERIVEAQTPGIDVVSGATFTSLGILNGTTEALMESMGGESDEG